MPIFKKMLEINPQYEFVFFPQNIDEDCNKIADEISAIGEQVKSYLLADNYKQAINIYLQLLKSMSVHFIEDEHYCYFDDMYSPEYALEGIYKEIIKYDINEEMRALLDIGHSEIMDSECYLEYGYPSYL